MNLALARFGAGRVTAALMVAWGFASAATALVETPAQFYAMRLLVGAAESGVYPGMMLYLTYWFPAAQRATAVGLVALSVPVAGLVGSPLSGVILDHTQGLAGLSGWQWLFIIEGLPAAFLAVLVLAMLTDRPQRARWLKPCRARLAVRHAGHRGGRAAAGRARALARSAHRPARVAAGGAVFPVRPAG